MKVLIIDDQVFYAQGLVSIIKNIGNIEKVEVISERMFIKNKYPECDFIFVNAELKDIRQIMRKCISLIESEKIIGLVQEYQHSNVKWLEEMGVKIIDRGINENELTRILLKTLI